MRSQIGHMFWSVVVIAVVMILSTFGRRSTEDAPASKTELSSQQTALVEKAKELTTRPLASMRSMMIDGRIHVLIDSRWYPKTKDNIYLVKGEKIYFVDNSKEAADLLRDSGAATEPAKPILRQPAAVPDPGAEAARLASDLGQNPVESYNPTKIKKMMETLEKAKSQMRERDAALKALSQE